MCVWMIQISDNPQFHSTINGENVFNKCIQVTFDELQNHR